MSIDAVISIFPKPTSAETTVFSNAALSRLAPILPSMDFKSALLLSTATKSESSRAYFFSG